MHHACPPCCWGGRRREAHAGLTMARAHVDGRRFTRAVFVWASLAQAKSSILPLRKGGKQRSRSLKLSRRLPENRRELALIHFGMIRGYWSLAEAASSGPVGDDARRAIEAETINALSGAASAADEFGPTEEGTVDAAQATLQRIFAGARRHH
jgi:hypothetical protein